MVIQRALDGPESSSFEDDFDGPEAKYLPVP